MKKMMFFISFVLFSQTVYVNDGLLAEALYYEDQGRIKYNSRTQDNVYFSTLENRIRSKYKDLNIPEIIIAESINLVLTGKPLEVGACYFCSVNYIVLRKDTVRDLTAAQCEWIIMHEAGHAQRQVENSLVATAICGIPLLVFYYWGIHKTEPYANFVTKLLSKSTAALIAGIIIGSELLKAEEKKADSWANEHADKEALLGGIGALNYAQEIIKKELSRDKGDSAILSQIPFCVAEWLCCPYHPSIDSRIGKIKDALKIRFGIDA